LNNTSGYSEKSFYLQKLLLNSQFFQI